MTETIGRVGVVGCGMMGAGIAEACADAGLEVQVAVASVDSVARGNARLRQALDRRLRKGKLTQPQRDAIISRLSLTSDLADLADCQLVIEAVTEHEATKLEVFAALDKLVDDQAAILASTTSAVPITRLARATRRAEYVIGMHFFNPAPVLPLVEVTQSLLTDELTCTRAESFITEALGKQVIRSPDRAGFVVNALLVPYLIAAIRMLESGFASADTIDRGMVLGCSHPMGPLQLADLIGLDTLAAVANSLYEEFREPLYAPPPLLSRMVDGGLLGKKTGRGFHEYS